MILNTLNHGKGVEIIIVRELSNEKETLGKLLVFDAAGDVIYACMSLELPYVNNERGVSCIPTGSYTAKKINSYKFGDCIAIDSVINRSQILIHYGNYYTQTRGCVLVGRFFSDLNKDGFKDVLLSRLALNDLLLSLSDSFHLWVLSK